MEQVIKISAPDGKKAVYDEATGTTKFIPADDYNNNHDIACKRIEQEKANLTLF